MLNKKMLSQDKIGQSPPLFKLGSRIPIHVIGRCDHRLVTGGLDKYFLFENLLKLCLRETLLYFVQLHFRCFFLIQTDM